MAQMREIRYNSDESKAKARRLHDLVHEEYTWEKTASRIRLRLEQIKEERNAK